MKHATVIFLSLLLLFSACGRVEVAVSDGGLLPGSAPAVSAAQPEPTSAAPEPIVRHLVAAGDIMSHMPQVEDARVDGTDTYDYTHMFAAAAPLLQAADYAVGNLETTLGGGPAYSGYPNFSSPDSLAAAAKDAGFDLLSTANNHTYDSGMDGIFRTLDVLDSLGIAHVGTYRTRQEWGERHGIVLADLDGITVAFLCYTYGLNGYSLPEGMEYAVNIFNLDYTTDLLDFDYARVESDMAAARELQADLIAVIIHWGVEYITAPTDYQRSTAEYLISQGADLVLGGHPHVLEPYETLTVTDRSGAVKQGFVCYSLGNFISNQQPEPDTKTTVLLELELTKTPDGKTSLTDVSYTPFYMVHRDDLPAGQRRTLVNIHTAVADYEAGRPGLITESLYYRLLDALAFAHEVLGEEGDRTGRSEK